MKNSNAYTSREEWLRAAKSELNTLFMLIGYPLPDNIRFAIAFTSTGKRGRMAGECWHPALSADAHFEIIIRADIDDPVEVLGILTHELIHTLLPPTAKHGKEFKAIATKIGLEGVMRHTAPSALLIEKLKAIASTLGALPHAKLNFAENVEAAKKQRTRWLKAECPHCGYNVRMTWMWAKQATPFCGLNEAHGRLQCKGTESEGNEGEGKAAAT